jgi:hypothetical protein
MSKKDFEMVAAVLVDQKTDKLDEEFSLGAESMRQALARLLAREFAQANPRFDRDRFLKAAGA